MFKTIKTLLRRGWLVRLPSTASSYARLLERLKDNQPFAFSRWGDGEWEAVLGTGDESKMNCDGHQYFSSLREALHRILTSNPSYSVGMQKLAYHKVMGRKIDRYLRANNIKLEWLNADAFHDASRDGKIGSFFDIISTKRILLVGPSHLRNLSLFAFDFCEVPAKNCWLKHEQVLADIEASIVEKKPEVILFCAGMMSNWLIDELKGSFTGCLIDVGSLLDPYAGVNSRNYHKKLSLAHQNDLYDDKATSN